jgi:anti-sigma factor ChrR (cupin superfamily)
MNPNERNNPMPDEPLTPQETAALYAAGALDDAEVARFEALVAAGDPDHLRALAEVMPVIEALAASIRPVEPPAEARRALEARLGIDPVTQSAGAHHHDHDDRAADPLVIVRRDQRDWRPTGLPGVRSKTLFADRASNRRTLLLNMAPGSRIPDHDHGGIEEVVVLEGDLSIGENKLKAGDYFRAQPGCRHGAPITEHGCIALVFSTYSSITTRTKIGFAIDTLRSLLRRGGNKSA